MKRLIPPINIFDIAAIGTWLAVFSICLYWLSTAPSNYQENTLLIIGGFVSYIICFIVITRHSSKKLGQNAIWLLMCCMLLSAFALLWLLPISFLPILTVIWGSLLPHFFTMTRSAFIMLIVLVLWFLVHKWHWHSDVFFSAVLYGSFHFFALMMTHHARAAELSTEEAQRLNRELLSTRELLAEASRQNERTRIARDLHDLLGHHLTALLINLQVASRLTNGDAKDKVEQCHSLAKLLLSDVREAVSTLREQPTYDLEKMITLIAKNLPNLEIETQIDESICKAHLEQIKTFLSCIQESITNCARHSDATHLSISLSIRDSNYLLNISNRGLRTRHFKLGNGLTGMKERVEMLKGQFNTRIEGDEFHVEISIPLAYSEPQSLTVDIRPMDV
jgi:signal transduction histidine kinase